jgi:hypothetical protein
VHHQENGRRVRGIEKALLYPSPGASHHPLPSGEGFVRDLSPVFGHQISNWTTGVNDPFNFEIGREYTVAIKISPFENLFRESISQRCRQMHTCTARLKLKQKFDLAEAAASMAVVRVKSSALPNDQVALLSKRASEASEKEEMARSAYLIHVKTHRCLQWGWPQS